MISDRDLGWAAGFLEGEGCFHASRTCFQVSANQVQREPLAKLQKLFGGRINLKSKNLRGNESPCHAWTLTGHRAAGLMMTVFLLMSPRCQEQIGIALSRWKEKQLPPWMRVTCSKGHPLVRYRNGGRRLCPICKADRRRKHQISQQETFCG